METIPIFATIEYLYMELVQEQVLLERYNRAHEDHYYGKLADENRGKEFEWKERVPHKRLVTENAKIIRRLLLQVAKGVQK